FALGPWATGMNVSMSLADVGVLKSIGPDVQKLENTLKSFGPEYDYLVFGYPPFVKSFVDATRLDLSAYRLDLVVGGEGISERLRAYLRRSFRSVVSSYGASDLEINIGIETAWTVALRGRCAADPDLCRALFGRETPPMIFQYNPLDYRVATLPSGEMAFTVCRLNGAAPKLRYNLKDEGGTVPFRTLRRQLAARGIDASSLAARHGAFPVLYVYGRSDLTVAFYGAKVYPADLEATVLGDPTLAGRVPSFPVSRREVDEPPSPAIDLGVPGHVRLEEERRIVEPGRHAHSPLQARILRRAGRGGDRSDRALEAPLGIGPRLEHHLPPHRDVRDLLL